MKLDGSKILLGVTGGVAAFKAILFLRLLQEQGAEVRVVQTDSSTRFVGEATFYALSGHAVARSHWDFAQTKRGELHVELANWSDAMVVYPATSNFVGSLAAGLADGLLGLCLQCFDGPRMVCPAMHHRMAKNPLFSQACQRLEDAGLTVLPPVVGRLASGESGLGRLPEPELALQALAGLLTPKDLRGRQILISAGPTQEAIDPVRFLSNHSSGKMGYALARQAQRRGADVVLVSGPCSQECPPGVDRIKVQSASEMHDALTGAFGDCDAVIMAAAVADFRPASESRSKLKKDFGPDKILLERTQDILASLAKEREHQVLVGFAMETEDLVARARGKLERKGLDLIVGNSLSVEGAGFGGDTNVVTLIGADGNQEELPLLSKDDVATQILDRLLTLLS